MRLLPFVLVLILFLPGFAQQPTQNAPGPDAAQAQPKKPGALEGRVVNGKTNEPLRRVNITLRPSAMGFVSMGMNAPAAPYAAATDAEGKFRIENVEPGAYRISAERQGFVRQEYGARRSMSAGTTISISPGQEVKDLNFKLTPQGIVVGRVLDEEGEPLARVSVQLLRRQMFRGKPQMMGAGYGQTNDRGEFRAADLPPGRYWVSATYRSQMMMYGEGTPRNTADKPEKEYVTTYYPGTIEQSGASPIQVEAGQELAGIDIRMQKAPVFRIRGKVAGAAQLVSGIRVMLIPRAREAMFGQYFGGGMNRVNQNGTFEIGSVQPGSYYVTAMQMQGSQSTVSRVPVDVTTENVNDVILTLGTGALLKGSVRLDGDVQLLERTQGQPVSLLAIRIQLMPADGVGVNVPSASTQDNGSFSLDNVGPDRYRISVYNTPKGTWLKSIRAGEQEVLDTGLDLSAGPPDSIQITLGIGVGQVSGLVQDSKQQPAAGSLVTLIPDPIKAERYDLFRTSPADQNGQFTLQGIPPGDYKLIAWEDVDPGSYVDPEYLKPHEGSAKKITVRVNSNEQVTLTQVPAEATAGK